MSSNESTKVLDRKYWTRGFPEPTARPTVRHYLARLAAVTYLGLVRFLYTVLASPYRKKRPDSPGKKGLTVFAIGPFFSENWSMAHMEALCKADLIDTVYLFTPSPYKKIANLQYVTHSPGLAAWFGEGIARILNAWKLARNIRPDLIIGYHLPWNGLMALLLAARTRSRAAYFSVGGPPELIGGGIYSEHALFSRLAREDAYVEKLLIALLGKFDVILTMGTRSQAFFRSVASEIPAIPIAVGISDSRFSMQVSRDPGNAEYDLVSVGRLSTIKQTDVFLRIIAMLGDRGRNVRAAIVGDGEQTENLEALARELDVWDRVRFFGWIDNVEEILQQSRLFVMTSSSEGLPHSLIEAMLTGIPAVAPDIGEIGDLVEDGLNGYLVRENDVHSFVDCIDQLLANRGDLKQFGANARKAALQYSVDQKVAGWDDALDHIKAEPECRQFV